MPAEWHPHSGTLMHWPSNRKTWPGERLFRVEEVFLQIIGILHRYEPVLLLTDPKVEDLARQRLAGYGIDMNRVHLMSVPLNDVWARDCGPIAVKREKEEREEVAFTDWEFNSWGGKYSSWDADNAIPGRLADRFGVPRFEPGMVLEGGAIEVNGEGMLLTTESVLLNPNRNPGLNREQIEEKLRRYLGVNRVVWLKAGLKGDDTDGHIDDLTRFLAPGHVVTMISHDPADVNYDVLHENLERLREVRTEEGKPLRIETLPMPKTEIEGTTVDGSTHVPASYANFYIANGVVLMPLYDDRYDQQAMELLVRAFPDRRVAGVPCADLVWGQGGIHCITQPLYGVGL